MLMKFFLLVFDILFAFDEPSSIFPARISILLRVVVVVLKPSGDGALILLLEEEGESLGGIFRPERGERRRRKSNKCAHCVCICMYMYILSALI